VSSAPSADPLGKDLVGEILRAGREVLTVIEWARNSCFKHDVMQLAKPLDLRDK